MMDYKTVEKYSDTEFTVNQTREINEGIAAGLDVSIYAKKEYLSMHMKQIRLGLLEGLKVEVYATPDYDWFQMEEIRLGMKAGLNLKAYARPEIPYDKMRQIRKGLQEGIDLTAYLQLDEGILRQLRKAFTAKVNIVKYIKERYQAEQLEEIRLALEKGVDIDPYLTNELRGASIREICKGLACGLDVSVYAKVAFGWQQMREIRKGLENRLDINMYANPFYSWQQMHEIRLGLAEGLDVSRYRSLMYTARDMERMRLRMRQEFMEGLLEATPDVLVEVEEESHGELKVLISRDEMEACIEVCGKQDTFDRDEIMQLLKRRGIVKGIDEAAVNELVEGKNKSKTVVIAKGIPSKAGEDGWYEYFFRVDINKAPKVLEDGSVDYQSIEWFELVEEGQTIAYYHTAGDGVCGYTVTGRALPTKRGKEQKVLGGKGFLLKPDQKTYVAAASGMIQLRENLLEISKLVVFDEVTMVNGNIDVDGSVYVKGNIGARAVIRATEDVIVDGFVQSAFVECGGSAFFRQGVNASGQGSIKAGRSVVGRFFEAVSVRAAEDIKANYCLNCELYAEGNIIISGNHGILAGGRIYAERGIQSYNVGNRVGIMTRIKLGLNESILQRRQEVEQSISEVSKELTALGNAYMDFQRKYPPEVRNTMDLYLKIESAIYTKEIQIKQLYKDREQVEEKLKRIGKATSVIKGKLYDGIEFDIDGKKWISKELSNVTVKRVGDKVVVRAN